MQQKCSFLRFFYKTHANTQQILPVQIGLYRCDEWMLQEINDENLNVNVTNNNFDYYLLYFNAYVTDLLILPLFFII